MAQDVVLDEATESKYPNLTSLSKPLRPAEREIIGREAEIAQLLAAMERPEYCNALLLAEAGTGKAHPLTTVIPVADERGYVQLGELKVGDHVYNRVGRSVEVTGVFDRGLLRRYRVHFVGGASVDCNDEHLWAVRNQLGRMLDRDYRVMELREIIRAGLMTDAGALQWSVPVATAPKGVSAANVAGDNRDLLIESVEDMGDEVPMACIMVDDPEHLYQVGYDHIVTHNTALVQATMLADERRRKTDPSLPPREYLEVDPARMINQAGDGERMAALLKAFFDEAEAYVRDTGTQLILFIDEFHQIIQLSDAATEAIKPVLAASGTRGIRVIAATTYAEFHQYIAPNQPLVERLQRINVRPPDQDTVVKILRGSAERYGVAGQFYDDHVLRRIYELTERYQPAAAQPRKSLLVLDSMIGWHRFTGKPMDTEMLASVLHDSLGIDVSMRVDGAGIKKRLDEAVFAQDMATQAVARRLQLSVADLNDKTRPEASFLFAGATGTGKTELTKTLGKLLFPSDPNSLIRFDMTEFADESSLGLFRSELTREMWNRPNSILLLDEVEKAASSVTRVLLQVLDDGRLSDDNGREVSFLNSYIVMTTNAGSEVFREIGLYAQDDGAKKVQAQDGERPKSLGEQVEHYSKLIRESITTTTSGNRFPPELLGRIDVIVPFSPLLESTLEKIVRRRLDQLRSEVWRRHSLRLGFESERILKYLIHDKGDSDTNAGGARGIMAIFTSEVATEVATFINTHPDCTRAVVRVKGDLASEHRVLYTDAHIVVEPS